MPKQPKYPEIGLIIDQNGPTGNIFFIVGTAIRAARGRISDAELEIFVKEIRDSQDYKSAIGICKKWFTCV